MATSLVAPAELAEQMQSGLADLVVQVTSRQIFEAAHVPGAVNVEPRELVGGVPPATGRLPELAR